MARLIPRVEDGVLRPAAGSEAPIRIDDPAWYTWLEEHNSFSFVTRNGAVTVRKERGRPSGWYWKAYRRVDGKVRTAYLGRTANLNLARLHAAAATLTGSATGTEPADGPALTAPAAPDAPAPPHAIPYALPQAEPDTLLRTKLFMPAPRLGRVRRLRLLDRLRSTPLAPVILVAAPPGYGKTTLVADWIASDQRTAAWLSLDTGDNDPGVFWSAVARALGTLHPEAGTRALHLLHSPQPPPLSTILPLLINDLTAHLRWDAAGRPALLVLDDYQVITQRAIHETVTTLIAYLPPQLRLVLTSRADPPLRLGRLRVRGQILEIRTADLAFDEAETAAFLLDTMGLTLPDSAAPTLAARTEGWGAALQLAALSLRNQPDPAAFITSFGGSHRPLLAYLIDEVFSQQPPARQEFLLATSVLDQMCAALCVAVIHHPEADTERAVAEAQALLEELEAANLFVVALDTTGHWYRYHRLFAETLCHRLRQRDPGRERDYRRRASAWYAEAGYGHAAIAQALAAQDWEAAATLIARFAEEARRHGELGTLAGWLGALPPALLHADPHLALLQALLLLFENQYAAVEPWLADVERSLEQTADDGSPPDPSQQRSAPAPMPGRVAVIHAQVARVLHSDMARSAAYALTALAELPADDGEWRTMALLNLATVAYFRDDLETALHYYTEAGAHAVRESSHLLTCIIRSRAAAVLYDLGRLQAAQALLGDTRRLVVAAAGEELPAICQLDWAEGLLCYEVADLPAAERLLARAITLAGQGRQREIQGFAQLTWSQVRVAQGDVDGALQAIEAAGTLLAPAQTGAAIFQLMLAAWQATALLARAAPLPDLASATPAFSPAWTELPDDRANIAHWLLRPAHLLPARARLAQGDPAGALSYLEFCCTRAEAYGAGTLHIAALAMEAIVLEALGRRAAARAALLRAVTQGAADGHIRSILDAGPAVGPLLHDLAQELIRTPETGPALLTYVVRLRDAAPPGDSPASAALHGGLPADSPGVLLTSREMAILRLLGAGRSNREIAAQLILGVSTVKWYLRTIYEKLGSTNRNQAVARARALGLIR